MHRIFGIALITFSIIIGAIFVFLFFSGGLDSFFAPELSAQGISSPEFIAVEPLTVKQTPVVTSQKVDVYIDDLAFAVGSGYEQAVQDALNLWQERHPVTFQKVDTEEEADLRIFWIKEFGSEKLGHARGSDLIEVGLGDSNCLEEWQLYSYDTVVVIAAHEIGHALGLDHVDDPTNVMSPILPTRYKTDARVSEYLPDDIIKYYPLCTKEEVAKYKITLESDSPVLIYALENEDQQQLVSSYEPFSHFEDCAITDTSTGSVECVLPQEAVLAVLQPLNAKGSARYSLTIEEVTQ